MYFCRVAAPADWELNRRYHFGSAYDAIKGTKLHDTRYVLRATNDSTRSRTESFCFLSFLLMELIYAPDRGRSRY